MELATRIVDLVISDDHAGLRKAIDELFTKAARQTVSFTLRNQLNYLPRKVALSRESAAKRV